MKRLSIFILSSLLIINSFVFPFLVHAAPIIPPASSPDPTAAPTGTWYNQSFNDWFNKVYNPDVSPDNEIFGERYTAAQVQWVIYGLGAFLINIPFGNSAAGQSTISCFLTKGSDLTACGTQLKTLLGDAGTATPVAGNQKEPNLLSLVFADRPLSGITYVKHSLQKFSLVPTAEAAGVGFGYDALAPVQSMWTASRDISFGLFVLVAIVFSFMIMFRVKISPQVVISVQSALPKLFIALILVTFSYAIAGFLIDLMYVVIGLLSLMFPAFIKIFTSSDIFNFMTTASFSSSYGATGVIGIITFSLTYLFLFILTLIGLLSASLMGSLGVILGGILSVLVTIIIIVLTIIAALVVVWNSIKIWWMLIKAFVNIILLTVFAPLQITFGTFIPSLGFGSWIKNFVTNLATFIMAGTLLVFSFVFLGQAFYQFLTVLKLTAIPTMFNSLGNFTAALLGSNLIGTTSNSTKYWPPLVGSGNSDSGIGLLFLAVSFVIYTLVPKVTDIIQSFMSGKPFAYGSAVGSAIGPGVITGQAIGDYRSGVKKAQIEGALRQAESRSDWTSASEYRRQLQQNDFLQGLIKKLSGGR